MKPICWAVREKSSVQLINHENKNVLLFHWRYTFAVFCSPSFNQLQSSYYGYFKKLIDDNLPQWEPAIRSSLGSYALIIVVVIDDNHIKIKPSHTEVDWVYQKPFNNGRKQHRWPSQGSLNEPILSTSITWGQKTCARNYQHHCQVREKTKSKKVLLRASL